MEGWRRTQLMEHGDARWDWTHTIQGPAKKAKKVAATPKKTPQKKSTIKSPPVSPRATKPPKTPSAAPKTPKTPKTASKVQAVDYEETPRRSTRLRTPARN